MAKILHVEDDSELASRVSQWFAKEGDITEIAENGEDALQMLDNYNYDLILLDWTSPGISGLDVCRRYRQGGGASWIIFITGKGDVENKEDALDYGADDYIVKPFDIRELTARVRSALRKTVTRQKADPTIGNVVLHASDRQLSVNGEGHRLTSKETALLDYLMRNPDRIFSTKHLLSAIWSSESEASEGTVRSIMRTLRIKLDSAGAPELIKTVLGSGYTIESTVKES